MALLQTLQLLSTPQSFERGEHYYEKGLVHKLVKKGEEYEAVVEGSRPYKQYINLANGFEGTCSCPYEMGGICKHLVAVGLAIEQEEFTQIVVKPTWEEAPEIELQTFFSEIFETANQGQKLGFLRQLLENNRQFRGQFTAFVSPNDPPPNFVKIEQIREEMSTIIKNGDFSYVALLAEIEEEQKTANEEYELYDWAAERIIHSFFQSFPDRFHHCLDQGNVEDALRVLLGMYEGFVLYRNAPREDYAPIDDFAGLLWEEYEEILGKYLDYLSKAVLAPAQLKRLQDLWFSRWDFYEKRYNYNQPEKSVRYDFPRFTKLLLALAQEEISLHYLDMRIQTYNLQQEVTVAGLLSGIAKKQRELNRG